MLKNLTLSDERFQLVHNFDRDQKTTVFRLQFEFDEFFRYTVLYLIAADSSTIASIEIKFNDRGDYDFIDILRSTLMRSSSENVQREPIFSMYLYWKYFFFLSWNSHSLTLFLRSCDKFDAMY